MPRIIYIHVPKCGGSSFGKALRLRFLASQATIDLRGFGPTAGSNTLILIDGRKLNNSADGASPDLSVIDIDDHGFVRQGRIFRLGIFDELERVIERYKPAHGIAATPRGSAASLCCGLG